jgi:hypothetical protein
VHAIKIGKRRAPEFLPSSLSFDNHPRASLYMSLFWMCFISVHVDLASMARRKKGHHQMALTRQVTCSHYRTLIL